LCVCEVVVVVELVWDRPVSAADISPTFHLAGAVIGIYGAVSSSYLHLAISGVGRYCKPCISSDEECSHCEENADREEHSEDLGEIIVREGDLDGDEEEKNVGGRTGWSEVVDQALDVD